MSQQAEAGARGRFEPVTITPEQLAELEARHEDVHVFRGPEKSPWLVVVRRPTRKETLGFKHAQKTGSFTANEQLIKHITVYPTGGPFDAQLDRWPFFPDGLAQSKGFQEFIGIAVQEDLNG